MWAISLLKRQALRTTLAGAASLSVLGANTTAGIKKGRCSAGMLERSPALQGAACDCYHETYLPIS